MEPYATSHLVRYGLFLPVALLSLWAVRSGRSLKAGQTAALAYGLAVNVVVLYVGAIAPRHGFLYTSYAVLFVTLGPFVDFFFGPHSGGHIGTMIGAASIGLEDDDAELSSGWGWSLFGGYDFWVSDQWAVGVNGRYMYAKGERQFDALITQDGESVLLESPTIVDTAHTFGIMFSALYH